MSVTGNRARHVSTAPDIERGPYGSALWPDNTRAAFYQLCDLARVPPDTLLSADELKARLWEHGEATKLRTVDRILTAMDEGRSYWREVVLL